MKLTFTDTVSLGALTSSKIREFPIGSYLRIGGLPDDFGRYSENTLIRSSPHGFELALKVQGKEEGGKKKWVVVSAMGHVSDEVSKAPPSDQLFDFTQQDDAGALCINGMELPREDGKIVATQKHHFGAFVEINDEGVRRLRLLVLRH